MILADDQPTLGGWLLNERREIDGKPANEWIATVEAELNKMENVTVLRRTTAFGYYDHNFVGMIEQRRANVSHGGCTSRQRLWRVRAKQVVLATGAIEQPMIFADNDRPGVMLAGAVRTYVNRYGVQPGKRVCVFTNNDDAYRTALDLFDAGISVPAIIDVRSDPSGALATVWGSAGDLDRATLPIALVVGALPLRANRVAVAGPNLRSVPAIKTHYY